MANSNGKAARRRLGNRYACKRHARKINPTKRARWAEAERERLRRAKNMNTKQS